MELNEMTLNQWLDCAALITETTSGWEVVFSMDDELVHKRDTEVDQALADAFILQLVFATEESKARFLASPDPGVQRTKEFVKFFDTEDSMNVMADADIHRLLPPGSKLAGKDFFETHFEGADCLTVLIPIGVALFEPAYHPAPTVGGFMKLMDDAQALEHLRWNQQVALAAVRAAESRSQELLAGTPYNGTIGELRDQATASHVLLVPADQHLLARCVTRGMPSHVKTDSLYVNGTAYPLPYRIFDVS